MRNALCALCVTTFSASSPAAVHDEDWDDAGAALRWALAGAALAAAATLTNRDGWKARLPAHALAAFMGASRIEAREQDAVDVLAGAAIGSLSGFLFTSKRDDSVVITPWADGDGDDYSVLIAGRF